MGSSVGASSRGSQALQPLGETLRGSPRPGASATSPATWLRFLARSSPYLSLFAIDFAAGAVNPLLPYLTASTDEFADISAAGAAAVAVGNIASGYLAGIVSIRWLMTVWLLVAAAANAGTALAPSFGVLLLCRVFANLADNWSLTQTLIDPNGSSAAVTGRATAAVLAGRVFGGVLGGLFTHGMGSAATCYLCAGVLVAAAALDAAVIPTRTADAQRLLRAEAEDEAGGACDPAAAASSVPGRGGAGDAGALSDGAEVLGNGSRPDVVVLEGGASPTDRSPEGVDGSGRAGRIVAGPAAAMGGAGLRAGAGAGKGTTMDAERTAPVRSWEAAEAGGRRLAGGRADGGAGEAYASGDEDQDDGDEARLLGGAAAPQPLTEPASSPSSSPSPAAAAAAAAAASGHVAVVAGAARSPPTGGGTGEATPLVRGAEEVDGGERDVGSAELRSLALLAASAPGLWAHTAVLVINGLICGALNTTVPAALKDEFHTDPEFVQYTQAADTALRSLASALLLPLLAVAVREPTRSAILAVALAGSLGLVLGVGEPLWPFVVVNAVAFSLQSVHQSAALAGFNAFVVSRARQLRGLVKGFAFAVFVSGISVGSFAAERVLQAWGREGLWWPLIAAAALCVLLNRFRPFDADKALAAVSSAS